MIDWNGETIFILSQHGQGDDIIIERSTIINVINQSKTFVCTDYE